MDSISTLSLGDLISRFQIRDRTRQDMLDLAVHGFCPICRRGPFDLLARHINAVHEVTRRDLANFLGVTFNVRLCSQSLSDQRRQKALAEENLVPGSWKNARREMSVAGTARLRRIGWKPGVKHRHIQPAKLVHGTTTGYSVGCRCDYCKGARRIYWKAHYIPRARKPRRAEAAL